MRYLLTIAVVAASVAAFAPVASAGQPGAYKQGSAADVREAGFKFTVYRFNGFKYTLVRYAGYKWSAMPRGYKFIRWEGTASAR